MSYTYPLATADFASTLPVQSFAWTLDRYEETSGTGRGDILVREIAAPKWRAEVSLRPMLPTKANEVQAMVEVLGANNQFHLYDLRKCGPRFDPTGSIIAGHSVTIHQIESDGKSLRLAGLPNGYRLVRGDMMSVAFAGRRAIYRITEDVIVGTSGNTPPFEVRPLPKTGTAVGNAVTLTKPAARMLMMGYDPGDRSGRFVTGAGFTAIEAY